MYLFFRPFLLHLYKETSRPVKCNTAARSQNSELFIPECTEEKKEPPHLVLLSLSSQTGCVKVGGWVGGQENDVGRGGVGV